MLLLWRCCKGFLYTQKVHVHLALITCYFRKVVNWDAANLSGLVLLISSWKQQLQEKYNSIAVVLSWSKSILHQVSQEWWRVEEDFVLGRVLTGWSRLSLSIFRLILSVAVTGSRFISSTWYWGTSRNFVPKFCFFFLLYKDCYNLVLNNVKVLRESSRITGGVNYSGWLLTEELMNRQELSSVPVLCVASKALGVYPPSKSGTSENPPV